MKSFLGCLLVTLITSLSAHAGIIIQPYVGYESGALKQDGQADIKTTGSFYGARLGYKFLGIMMGLDYMTGSEKADQNGAKDDYKPTDYGAFLGYEFPAVIQIYGTFFTNSSTKISPGTYPSDFTGRGVRFGIGWTGLPYLRINLETISRTYTKYDAVDLLSDIKGSSTALTLSLSLP